MSHFIIDNERRCKFWKDRCCGDLSLEGVPTLFSIAYQKLFIDSRGVGAS